MVTLHVHAQVDKAKMEVGFVLLTRVYNRNFEQTRIYTMFDYRVTV